jgi:hypothetical protein
MDQWSDGLLESLKSQIFAEKAKPAPPQAAEIRKRLSNG